MILGLPPSTHRGSPMEHEYYLTEQEFALFSEVTQSFQTIVDLEAMIASVIMRLSLIVDIEGASIALHDQKNGEFYFIHTVEDGGFSSVTSKNPIKISDQNGVAGWVLKHDETVVINDVTRDQRFQGDLQGSREFTTRSMICVPLRTRKGFLGVLYALNKKSGDFTQKEKRILETISGSIAISLENAQLYGELKKHAELLEREKEILLSQIRSDSEFSEIIGSSPPMLRMFSLIYKVLNNSTTVLIQGETGTGKELVARVIHFNGKFKDKPFVAENCGALPESLLESELFGHVKGAFTGAVQDKKGLFEVADGGTIFLDEVGEMTPLMQLKLLRVLQEGQFRPVGSSETRTVNVRVIAATNRDLAEEIENGNFRKDLYYRINVFQITPPPLRDRKEDIPDLAHHFIQKFSERNGLQIPELSPQALQTLMLYPWPGNVRELENEIERALTMAGEHVFINPDHLSDRICGEHRTPIEGPARFTRLKDAVHQVEKQMVRRALEESAWNKSQAAKTLGLSRQGLLNKIAAYNLEKSDRVE